MRDYKKEVTSTKSQKHGLELCWLLGNVLKGWNTAELQTNICSENWSETCEREVRESLWRQKYIKTREWDNECVTWSSEHCKAITSLSSLINVQSFKSRNKTCRLRIERWALRPATKRKSTVKIMFCESQGRLPLLRRKDTNLTHEYHVTRVKRRGQDS